MSEVQIVRISESLSFRPTDLLKTRDTYILEAEEYTIVLYPLP
jgi:hypothetical protein